jgi:hypothetical protein
MLKIIGTAAVTANIPDVQAPTPRYWNWTSVQVGLITQSSRTSAFSLMRMRPGCCEM